MATQKVLDGMAKFTLPYNVSYTVEVPAYIDLIHNKVRAMFVNWSDGQKYTNRSNSIERNVTLHNDIDLFALYKTQYRLLVNSSGETQMELVGMTLVTKVTSQ